MTHVVPTIENLEERLMLCCSSADFYNAPAVVISSDIQTIDIDPDDYTSMRIDTKDKRSSKGYFNTDTFEDANRFKKMAKGMAINLS